MSSWKGKTKRRQQEFLLSFFKKPDKSEFKEVNGFILNKYRDGNTKRWGVMIFTKDSWRKAQNYKKWNTKIKDKKTKSRFRTLYEELERDINSTKII